MDPEKHSAEEMDLDREEAALREEAVSIDPARPADAEIPDVPSEAEERATASGKTTPKASQRPGSAKQPDATGATKPEISKAKADTAAKPDAAAKDKQPTPQDKTPKPGEVDESKLTPFQRERLKLEKERVRLDETWKKAEARKAELDARERTLAEREQKLTTAPRKSEGPSAEDYEAIAKDYEAEGKLQLAAQCRAKAAELRKQQQETPAAPSGPRERFSPEEIRDMEQKWQSNLQKLGEENPELTQEGTPMRTRVAELLKTVPVLRMSGDGIVYAVEVAKLEQRAKRAAELETQVAELQQEVQRLTDLTSLPGGHAAPAATATKFDELSLDEQERALREEATAG